MTLLSVEGTSGQAASAAPAAASTSGSAPASGAESQSAPAANPTTPAAASWRDALPEDVRGNMAISQFQDVGALAKSYIHAQAMIGKKGVFVPGEKASEEEWGNFGKEVLKSAGIMDLEKYGVEPPQGVQVNPEVFSKFKEQAFKNGLLPKQSQNLLNWFTKAESEAAAATKAQKEAKAAQEISKLKHEWGDAFKDEVGDAHTFIREVFGEEGFSILKELGVENDVRLARGFAKAGKKYREDKLRGDNSGRFGKTREEKEAELFSLRANPAYTDRKHGDNKKINLEVAKLYQELYPDQKN